MSNLRFKEDIQWMPDKGYINMPEGAEVCEIDRETYYRIFECMPPLDYGINWFACSEPHSHVWNGQRYVPTFGTYSKTLLPGKERYFYHGALTEDQLKDVHTIIKKHLYDEIR